MDRSQKVLLIEQLKSLLSRKQSRKFYAAALGVTEGEITQMLNEIRSEKIPNNVEPGIIFDSKWVSHASGHYHHLVEEKIENDGKDMNIKGLWSEKPHTGEEIEEKHGIDTTKWKLSSFWSKNTDTSDGSEKWLVSAFFKRRELTTDLKLQKELILSELKKESPYSNTIYQGKNKEAMLYEISIFDHHFGKLAWGAETGDDYDITIAEQRYNEAMDSFIARILPNMISHFHIPLGNDLFHVDNYQGTTSNFTPQDRDSRFAKMVQIVKRVMIANIEKLARIAPVVVTIVQGNHDKLTTFMLGEILSAYFHNSETVTINNTPRDRKFYQWGECMFMYTHGDEEKQGDLGIIMATEEPVMWGVTKHRYVKVGHFHKHKRTDYITIDNKPGVQVEILPSLSGTDAWHYRKGYLPRMQAKAALYDSKDGEVATFTYTV